MTVEDIGGLFGILFALLEIELFLYHILIAADVEGEGGKLIEIADLAEQEREHGYIILHFEYAVVVFCLKPIEYLFLVLVCN